MIYLESNNTNKVVLTLKESSTFSNPYYLFQFKNEFTGNVMYFTTPNLSFNTCRYDLFEITLDDNGAITDSIDIPIYLEPGQYEYKVYESEVETININDTNGKAIEIGRMIVSGETPQINNDEDYY